MKKIIFYSIAFLFAFSAYLAIAEYSGSTFCLTNSDASNCQTVQNSEYGSIFGFKVSTFGPIAFAVLLIFYFLANKKSKYRQNFYEVYLLMAILGFLFSIYFLAIQFFVLKQICSTCLVIDFGMIFVGILSFAEYKKRR